MAADGTMIRIRKWLSTLSFRTGMMVGVLCLFCYTASFAQLLLPLPAYTKGILWTVLFGLAKATQYTTLIIIGKAGLARLRQYFGRQS